MRERTILVWFRNDLRLHDNELLVRASERNQHVLPFYCFDPRQFAISKYGLRKTGALRAAFILDNVKALKNALKAIGSDLVSAVGHPEEVIPEICKHYQIDEVYHHREVAQEETHVSGLVEEALWKMQLNLKHFIGHTLYHKEDLPFPIKDIPNAFSVFRKKTERESSIRPTFATPNHLSLPEGVQSAVLPSLLELGFTPDEVKSATRLTFKGGEQEAFIQMDAFLKQKENLDDSHLSPYIAVGALSPNTYYHALTGQDSSFQDKKSKDILLNKLLWRDYFRFMFKKHGNLFFQSSGLTGQTPENHLPDDAAFSKWMSANTGEKVVDFYLQQLHDTGFIPVAARFLVAAYLVYVLKVNWLKGAAYFEEKLIDYGPSNNYGNWAHVAGVGSSSKENKPIDIHKLITQLAPDRVG